MILTHLLGERRRRKTPDMPYESGMPPTGSARLRFSADFYLVAMFFVIFDIQAVFIFAWAVAARELKWAGYAELLVFLAVLGAGLAYLWRRGAFDWSSRRRGK
jgi:NADH-quinone oxidoreductase subunit A